MTFLFTLYLTETRVTVQLSTSMSEIVFGNRRDDLKNRGVCHKTEIKRLLRHRVYISSYQAIMSLSHSTKRQKLFTNAIICNYCHEIKVNRLKTQRKELNSSYKRSQFLKGEKGLSSSYEYNQPS